MNFPVSTGITFDFDSAMATIYGDKQSEYSAFTTRRDNATAERVSRPEKNKNEGQKEEAKYHSFGELR